MIKKLWIIAFLAGCLCLTSCGETSKESEWLTVDSTDSTEYIETVIEDKKEIIVYLCGEVVNPGVYTLDSSQRLFEAIAMAGGLTKDADLNEINQAEELSDGEKVFIPSKNSVSDNKNDSAKKSDGKININKADVLELTSIAGIGQSRAMAIVEYRQEHGAFKSTKDIMQVSGIKDGLYEKIKNKIKVD